MKRHTVDIRNDSQFSLLLQQKFILRMLLMTIYSKLCISGITIYAYIAFNITIK